MNTESFLLTLGSLICIILGHKISSGDEKKIINLSKPFETECARCHYPLTVESDPKEHLTYYVTEN
jgi:hypothetical protein